MKIANSAVESLIERGVGSVTGIDAERPASVAGRAAATASDSVKLSNGSNLTALTRASFSNAHIAKVRTVASQVSAGIYHTDSLQTSQAVVEGHLRG